MSTQLKQPSRDLIQIFCTNFPSHFDFSDGISHRISDIRWSDQFDAPQDPKKLAAMDYEKLEKINCLKLTRQVLEVFNAVLQDDNKSHKNLAEAILEFYAPTPIKKLCYSNLIAEALIKEKLVVGADSVELEEEILTSFSKWRDQAIKKSQDLLLADFPDIKNFEGKADWIMMGGVVRWGPVRTLRGDYYPPVSQLVRNP